MLHSKKFVSGFTITLLVVIAVSLQKYWYPGLTKKQTVNILLNDDKYGVRAFDKAVWHGESILSEIAESTSDFRNVDYQQAKRLARLINELAINDADQLGTKLYSDNSLYPKLIGALILSKTKKASADGEIYPFLQKMVFRDYPGLDKSLFKVRDYYSEIAINAIAYYHDDESFILLKRVLDEEPSPYSRHASAASALARLNDRRAVKLLHEKILDKNFKAVLPAIKALVKLGDKRALEFAEQRLAMKQGGDDSLVRQYVDQVFAE